MKIAIFSDTFPPQVNGVSHVVAQSALRLSLRGHDVHVITASQGSRKYLESVSQGKYVIHKVGSLPSGVYPDLRVTMPMGTTMLKLRGWKPDIVHTHTPFGVGLAAVRCAKRFGVPLIGTHHTFFDHYLKHAHIDSKLTRRMSWKFTVNYYDHCDLVLAPSQDLADELVENGLKAPVRILRNPIDTELFGLTQEEQEDCGGSGADLVYMGRLSYEKSVDQVIRAFSYVLRQIPAARLTVIGDGPERPRLEEEAAELGLEGAIAFTGILHGEELAQALRRADLFVTASKTENIPLSVLEAMASGLPVAAVAMKGIPEIVHDGINGILVAPDDPKELGRRVAELIQDQERLEQYSIMAQEFAMGFSQDTIMKESELIYETARSVL